MNVDIQLQIPTALSSEENLLWSKDSAVRPLNIHATNWALPANHRRGTDF